MNLDLGPSPHGKGLWRANPLYAKNVKFQRHLEKDSFRTPSFPSTVRFPSRTMGTCQRSHPRYSKESLVKSMSRGERRYCRRFSDGEPIPSKVVPPCHPSANPSGDRTAIACLQQEISTSQPSVLENIGGKTVRSLPDISSGNTISTGSCDVLVE